jgi:TrpR family trp operon transcriptional repressor
MPKQSKKGDSYRELLDVLRSIAPDSELFSAFMDDLLTPMEQKELGLRWQIVKALAEGKTQREVAADLGVSIATVTRGAGVLKNTKGGFHRVSEQRNR